MQDSEVLSLSHSLSLSLSLSLSGFPLSSAKDTEMISVRYQAMASSTQRNQNSNITRHQHFLFSALCPPLQLPSPVFSPFMQPVPFKFRSKTEACIGMSRVLERQAIPRVLGVMIRIRAIFLMVRRCQVHAGFTLPCPDHQANGTDSNPRTP